jgi:FlaA1/EpsC-like NDP-sugar epimerase
MQLRSAQKEKLILVFTDILLMILAYGLAIHVRYFEWGVTLKYLSLFWWLLPFSLLFRLSAFQLFGLYHWRWNFASLQELNSLVKALLLSSILLFVFVYTVIKVRSSISILIIDSMLCFILVGGSRLIVRLIKDSRLRAMAHIKVRKVMVIGAGHAGEMIVKEMLSSPQLGYRPIGFVDDDPEKQGQYIHYFPVLGKISEIRLLAEKYKIDEIIIALPSVAGKDIRKIYEICDRTSARLKIMPGINETVNKNISISRLKDVEIDDLLRRELIRIDAAEISAYLSDARVLVTGAAGSIGAELSRQVAFYKPAELILIDKDENGIFNIETELHREFPELQLSIIICDIKDDKKIAEIFRVHSPSVVFHSAAYKHVPLMEKNPDEAVSTNVTGTRVLADAAQAYAVDRFIMVSTDKVVNPSSILGLTKRLAEMYLQSKNGGKTKYASVRFGNVLNSRGSVIPLFKKQIVEGGPVTVTHPEAKRYFMTVSEAVQLIIQAGAMSEGGETFVLEMGLPVKIIDLARDLIKLYGLEEGKDINIQFTGLRPGEKIFEQCLTAEETRKPTKHKEIFIVSLGSVEQSKLIREIDNLEKLALNYDLVGIRGSLRRII